MSASLPHPATVRWGRLALWAMGMLSIWGKRFSLALRYEEAHDSPPWATHPFQLLLPPHQAKQRSGLRLRRHAFQWQGGSRWHALSHQEP